MARNGNSWSVRLLKPLLREAGIKPEDVLYIEARPGGRIIISSENAIKLAAEHDKYDVARRDVREALDAAFDQAWLEIFGIEE